MIALFNRFEIEMSLGDAESVSHGGSCDADVAILLGDDEIQAQLESIGHDAIRAELAEYGAWTDDELANWEDCKGRILWIAGGNICEEIHNENE